MSQFHYLTDEDILASIDNDASYLRACAFDDKTTFAVVAVPSSSRYSGPGQSSRLIMLLSQHGLVPTPYKASGSDDLHLYLTFEEAINSNELGQRLRSLLMHGGFEISPDTLIVYPSETPLALPLQKGFAWLNEDLQVKLCRDDISLESALALFLADMKRNANSYEALLAAAPGLDQSKAARAELAEPELPLVESLDDIQSRFEPEFVQAHTVDANSETIIAQPDQLVLSLDSTDYAEAEKPISDCLLTIQAVANSENSMAGSAAGPSFVEEVSETVAEPVNHELGAPIEIIGPHADSSPDEELYLHLGSSLEQLRPPKVSSSEPDSAAQSNAKKQRSRTSRPLLSYNQLSLFSELLTDTSVPNTEPENLQKPSRASPEGSGRPPPADT